MSITLVSLGSVGDTNARSAHTCTIFRAPADNALVLVSVLATDISGTAVEPTGVVGMGLTFSLITSSVSFGTIASPAYNLSAWRAMGSSVASSVVTATFNNNTNGCAMLVAEISGVSQGGSNGASAVGQSATTRADGVSRVTILGPSATSTVNAWLAMHSAASSEQGVPAFNFAIIDRAVYATPDAGLISAWTLLSTGTTSAWTSSGVDNRGGIIVELVADNPAIVFSATTAGSAPRRFRLPPVPSAVSGVLGSYLRLVVKQLNQEGYISLFSGANPNTSGVTGIPGNLLINIGSASTSTRLWGMEGSIASVSTNSWRPLRIA